MDHSTAYFVYLIICLFFSGFFSASETALTSLTPAKTKQLLDLAPKKNRFLKLWITHPNHVLTAILVGNNIVNTLSAVLATVIAEKLFGSFAITLTTAFITLALLVFGEVTPKTFAKHNAESFAPKALVVIWPFYWLVAPLVFLLSKLASSIVVLSGGRAATDGPAATEEDIEFMIRLGHQEGVLHRDEGELLESVMEFGDTVVREVMVPRTDICSFSHDTGFEEVFDSLEEKGHSRWPVYEDSIDNVLGVLHAKDLLRKSPDSKLVDLVRPALFVPETMKVGSLLKECRRGRAHLAIVVDEYGGTAGIVSIEDLLEELVGEIHDEYDNAEEEQYMREISENRFVVSGKANLDDVAEKLSITFPKTDSYDSLGGFIGEFLDKMPEKGDEFHYLSWKFVVQDADKKRVISVLVYDEKTEL